MKIPMYQVDAFTRSVFGGNPAAVCPLDAFLPDAQLQSIASENNLSETAFIVGGNGRYALRWFTPVAEVKLCGHATLASAYVVCTYLETAQALVEFSTKSGTLPVKRTDDLYELDFPAFGAEALTSLDALNLALGAPAQQAFRSDVKFMAVFENEEQIQRLSPTMEHVIKLPCQGLIATAPGNSCDFVSRFFAPGVGIPEDPVTGSAHCSLIPYWAKRLGKAKLHARQISKRGGELSCELRGARVGIAGHVAPYLQGFINL